MSFRSQVRSSSARLALALGAVALALGACTTQVVSRQVPIGPTLAVERFLQAANTRDLESMSRLFGTPEGPISDRGGTMGCAFKRMGSWLGMGDRCLSRSEVELRMDLIARILRHDDFQVTGEEHVAGRIHPTTQVSVRLQMVNGAAPRIPFMVVESSGGWLVQEVDLERITGP